MKRIIIFFAAFALMTSGAISAQEQEPNQDYSRFRLSLEAGGGYRFGRISNDVPSDFKSYTKKLKRGYVCSADATWFFKKDMGVGMRYKVFNASNSTSIQVTNESSTTYGKMEDNIRIAFIGPMFCTRFSNPDSRHTFTADVGAGYVNYTDKGKIINDVKLSGGTMGLLYNIGYDYALSRRLSLGANLSLIQGTLYELTAEANGVKETQSLDKDSQENLSHIDLTFTLRFNL